MTTTDTYVEPSADLLARMDALHDTIRSLPDSPARDLLITEMAELLKLARTPTLTIVTRDAE